MRQPVWQFVTNLGDASPLDHGGLFLYEDETGVYAPEMELLEPPCDDHRCSDADGTWGQREESPTCEHYEVRRVCLEPLKEVRDGDTMHVVPASYDASWPHPVAAYREWYADADDLGQVAASVGMTVGALRADLLSDDSVCRACGYRTLAEYHGWSNFDDYPLLLSRAAVEVRYMKGELK